MSRQRQHEKEERKLNYDLISVLPPYLLRYCGRKLQTLRMVLKHLSAPNPSLKNSSKVTHTLTLPDWLLAVDDDTMANPMTLLRTLGEHDPKVVKTFGNT